MTVVSVKMLKRKSQRTKTNFELHVFLYPKL